MTTIFDIGMYDCADTAYYLEMGNRVVAVEANQEFVQRAQTRFKTQIGSGQLTVVNAAIFSSAAPVELVLSGDDLGASSLFGERIADRQPIGTITAPGLPVHDLLEQFGIPHFLKVDIEGADRLCVLNLTADARPRFLSFEIGADVEELLDHLRSIGYDRFKIINQISFRELANQSNLRDRLVLRLFERLGVGEPRLIKRAGRFFVSGRSSGPVPWQSDGRWYSGQETVERWRRAQAASPPSAWYDIHATF
jgi:FkbM family methyltransferase